MELKVEKKNGRHTRLHIPTRPPVTSPLPLELPCLARIHQERDNLTQSISLSQANPNIDLPSDCGPSSSEDSDRVFSAEGKLCVHANPTDPF
jgi:hypothetical protein